MVEKVCARTLLRQNCYQSPNWVLQDCDRCFKNIIQIHTSNIFFFRLFLNMGRRKISRSISKVRLTPQCLSLSATLPFLINSNMCPEKSPTLPRSCFSLIYQKHLPSKLGNACRKWKARFCASQIVSEAEKTQFVLFHCEDDISSFVSKRKKRKVT